MNETKIKISSECRPEKKNSNLDWDLERHIKGSTSQKIWYTALITWYTIEDAINQALKNE